MDDIRISQHAVDRFLERCQKIGMGRPRDPEEIIRKHIAKAQKENMHPTHRVKRLIEHQIEAEYYISDGWRFVIVDGCIVTIERTTTYQN